MSRYVFTSESVSEGHPDKVCDFIADSILDAHLEADPRSRVACEVLVKSGHVVLAGEITSKAAVDYEAVARRAIREIGYVDAREPFNADGVRITQHISRQSCDIAMGVDTRDYVISCLCPQVLGKWYGPDVEVLVNPTGQFIEGGPSADAGVTGRKIIVDTYGGAGRHGGGAFSGKDPSKVDRSGAYFGRFVARQLVRAGLARKAEVQVAYAIGRAEPVSVRVDTFGTGDARAAAALVRSFDFRPQAIIERLGLRAPIYRRTTNYGHFGRAGLPWEA